jgi:crotonobetainyl-CoA:carnitine CoA-transferase CaiB-like acyl-CoA transferase
VNYIGYAGVLSIIGEEGRRPVLPGVQVGDLAGGGMAAAAAILAALVRRASTGTGDFCDISMTDGAVSWLSIHAAEFVATKQEPQRELMHLSGLYPCYRVYPAADGWITVGALEPQFWAELCEAIDRPDLAGDAFATGPRRSEIVSELESLFSTKTRAAWMEHFADRDVCVGPVKSLPEAFDDPQVRARGMVFESDVEGVGEWTHIGNPLKVGEARTAGLRRQPPKLGEHTEEVLAGAGFSAAEIEDLRAAGSI